MTSNTTLSVAIMSGKGGVGKTNIALNLGYSLHQMGFSALLIDCDMGLANLDVLLGITPEGSLQDVLLGNASIDEVVHKIAEGFDILPAASGVPELIDIDPDMRSLLLNRLDPVLGRYDFVFMDLGAGINETVLSFAAMASLRVVVITTEPTSLTDSYALIKVLANRYAMRDFTVLVNQVEAKKEEERSFKRLQAACQRFLNIDPVLLGSVRSDRKLVEAVLKQEPLLKWAPGSPAAQDLQKMAAKLQKIRLSMLDWMSNKPILRNPAAQ